MKCSHLPVSAYSTAIAISFLLLFSNSPGYSQQKISGIVRSADNAPLDGATIMVKGSNLATTSAADGSFSILAKPEDYLSVSLVGMVENSVQVRNQIFITITLSFKITNLDEVVVIGYGTAQRKDITGAVAKIKAKEFNAGIITNPLQQLQGKVAGLVIIQPGGDPNGDFIVRIRGAASLEGQPPLLVIDGVAIDDFFKAVNTVNPADIESYDILKDASAAAIYGARGANGVILPVFFNVML